MKMKKLSLKKIQILWDNVLVKPIIDQEDSVIIKPKQYEHKPETGIVVKVGEGRLLDNGDWVKPRVKEGDLIVFNQYSPTVLKIDSEDYLYIREEDIISRQE